MEILEFGNKANKKIILIHGFQSPYQIWEDYIEYYKNDFHILVPVLPGHNPKCKEDFISFEQTAKELEDYYISRYGNEVYAVYGMSMGGVLAATLWQNKRLHIEKLIFESSPLVSYNKIMKHSMLSFYLKVTHKTQQRDEKTIKQAVNSIIPEDKLDVFLEVLDNMSDATIINYINEIGNYRLPKDIDTPDTAVYYYYGSTINELLAKKTAGYISKNYPGSTITCFNGKGHCEDSLMNPEAMIKELNKVLIEKYQT